MSLVCNYRRILILLSTIIINSSIQLDNGLGTKPPLGWSSRLAMKKNGTTETDLKNQVDSLIRTQLLSKGYSHILLENWIDIEGSLNTQSIKPLEIFTDSSLRGFSAYLHGLRMNLGVSLDRNYHGCQAENRYYDEYEDVYTITDWDIDLVYIENCTPDDLVAKKRFFLFSETVNKTGKPLFIITGSPPDEIKMMTNPVTNALKVSQLEMGSWDSFCQILDDHVGWRKLPQKGAWPYLGVLELNEDHSSSFNEYECKFAFLSLIKSPIFLANDLNSITTQTYELIGNEDIIKISQDELGLVGQRVIPQSKNELTEVWAVELSGGRVAVLFINRSTRSTSAQIEFENVMFKGVESNIYDLLKRRSLGAFRTYFKTGFIEPKSCMYLRLDPAD